MAIYIGLLILVLVMANQINASDDPFYYENKKGIEIVGHSYNARFAYRISALVLILIAGLRYNVGADFEAYYWGVLKRSAELIEKVKGFDEPGYSMLCRIATIIRPNDPHPMAIFMAAAITISVMLYVIYRNSEYLSLSLFLYLTLVWSACFNGIRQSLAAAILLLGFPYIKERRFFRFLIVVLIASLFHKSVFVMIPIYFVAGRKASIKNLVLVIIASVVVLYSYDWVFHLAGQIMSDVDTTSYSTRAVNIFRSITACSPAIVFWGCGLHRDSDNETAFYLNITLVHAALAIASSGSSYLARIYMYTDPFMVIVIPHLCRRAYERMRLNIVPIMTLLYSLYWLYGLYADSTARVFQFVWQR